MNEQLYEKDLERVDFGVMYYQIQDGLYYKADYKAIGKLYIHQITIKRDIKDRYEPLYSIKYNDYVFNETKLIENKTFSELVNFIDKQKLITEKKCLIKVILSHCILRKHDNIVNGIEFVRKEKVDFKKEGLPMNNI